MPIKFWQTRFRCSFFVFLILLLLYYLVIKKKLLMAENFKKIETTGTIYLNGEMFLEVPGKLKGQIKSECIYEIMVFPKYHRKNLIDFCPESLFRLGMICTHLGRVALRIIKTYHIYLVYKTFQGRIYQIFSMVFWKINDFINTFWYYLTFRKGIMFLIIFSNFDHF